MVINVNNSQVVFEKNAMLTLPTDNAVVEITDRHSTLSKVSRLRTDACSFSREASSCAAISSKTSEMGRIERDFFGKRSLIDEHLANNSGREGDKRNKLSN